MKWYNVSFRKAGHASPKISLHFLCVCVSRSLSHTHTDLRVPSQACPAALTHAFPANARALIRTNPPCAARACLLTRPSSSQFPLLPSLHLGQALVLDNEIQLPGAGRHLPSPLLRPRHPHRARRAHSHRGLPRRCCRPSTNSQARGPGAQAGAGLHHPSRWGPA